MIKFKSVPNIRKNTPQSPFKYLIKAIFDKSIGRIPPSKFIADMTPSTIITMVEIISIRKSPFRIRI